MTSFFIAVPSLRSAEFLGRCLASVLEMQAGDFDLHVRVQDGGSSDGTLAVAEEWRRRIAAGGVPDAARRRLSIVSGRDAGLYDAVATAFDSAGGGGHEVLAWLGSDDLLMTGALATVARVFERFPEIRWLTGQPQVIDHEGAWYTGWRADGFARRDLRRGLHEGRGLPFVMQEGTFWRTSLYREAGGLRRDLRLAGDFDLWRRFARTDELVMCSFPLGAWRHRSGQASADKSGYYREVDRVLSEDPPLPAIEEEAGREDASLRFRPVVLDRYLGDDYALRVEGLPFHPLEGFGPQERPAPAFGLHASFIRMIAPVAKMRVPIRESGVPYRIAIRFRNPHPDQWLTIRMGDVVVHDAAVTSCGGASQVVAFTRTVDRTEPVLTVECRSDLRPAARRGLVDRLRGLRAGPALAAGELLVEDVAFERVANRAPPAALG